MNSQLEFETTMNKIQDINYQNKGSIMNFPSSSIINLNDI